MRWARKYFNKDGQYARTAGLMAANSKNFYIGIQELDDKQINNCN